MIASRVWYVSYGSNMAEARLMAYLRGGTPPGSVRAHPGARDPADPLASEPCSLAHRRFFAGTSRTWDGGGVAYVDPEPGSGDTPARRYLITMEQFHDVWAQESGRPVGTTFGPVAFEPETTATLGRGGYDRLVVLGRIDGIAMVTFTTPRDPASLVPNPPSAAYRAMIIAGLAEGHGMGVDEAGRLIDAEVADTLPPRTGPRAGDGNRR